MAINAGRAGRQMQLAERQGALIEQVLTAACDALELTSAQRKAAPDATRPAPRRRARATAARWRPDW